MWTYIRFFVCADCAALHIHLIDNVPNKQGDTIAMCDAMVMQADPRFRTQSPCYEIVHPNHAHAIQIRKKCPDACTVWDEEHAEAIDRMPLPRAAMVKRAEIAAITVPDRGNMVKLGKSNLWSLTLLSGAYHATLLDDHLITDRN